MTKPIPGYGTTLSRAGNTIARTIKFGGPKKKRAMIDVSGHDSPDGYLEFIPGMKDGGSVTIDGSFIPGDTNGQVGLEADFEAGTLQSFVLTLPGNIATWTFNAYVEEFGTDEPYADKVPFAASLRIDGKPTLGITQSAGLTTTFFSISNSAVITPAPANAAYTYVATVLNGVTSVTVTPIAAAGTITVNGNTVATGVPSSAITLGAAGSVTVITIVVTETGKSPKTYTIYLSRAT